MKSFMIGGVKVDLNPSCLEFNEQNLSLYQHTIGRLCEFYGGCLAEATQEAKMAELSYETIYNSKFIENKPRGSDVLTKSYTLVDLEVVAAKETVIRKEYVVNQLKSFCKALDTSHDAAKSRNYSLQKELGKLFSGSYPDEDLNDIFKKGE